MMPPQTNGTMYAMPHITVLSTVKITAVKAAATKIIVIDQKRLTRSNIFLNIGLASYLLINASLYPIAPSQSTAITSSMIG